MIEMFIEACENLTPNSVCWWLEGKLAKSYTTTTTTICSNSRTVQYSIEQIFDV